MENLIEKIQWHDALIKSENNFFIYYQLGKVELCVK